MGRAGGRLLAESVQCVTDFLVEDGCRICGREPDTHPGPDPRRDTRPLADPVTVRFAGPIPIRNRPVCPACLAQLEPARRTGRLEFEGRVIPVIAPFMTNDPVLKIVHLAKFAGYQELIGPMARTIARRAPRTATPRVTVMAPVPLWRGERRRPVEHAAELARAVSTATGIPVLENSLVKHRRTARQSVTAAEHRPDNVRGAFGFAGTSMAGADVWIVDDLVTTGATAGACAAVLLGAGAENVGVLCFARSL